MSTNAIAGNEIKALPATGIEVWKTHLAALAAIILALAALFFSDIYAAVKVWWYYPAYSHCFLIIPISGWLIWEKRTSLFSDSPAANPAALAAALPFVALWFVGRFASITEFRQFALIGLAEVAIIAVLGWHIFRRISFACLYLFFLVPTGQYLIPPLQEITAKFVETGLTLFSIPFFRDGLIFQLVNGFYEIAEACAGLRFLVATVALGVLFAHLMYRRPLKIVLFMAACLIVPVIGNGIRALATVMVANYTNNRIAAGFDHIVYGWVFAVAIIFTVMYVGMRFRDAEADAPPPPGAFRALHPFVVLATVLGALATFSIGPAAAWIADRQPSVANQTALNAVAKVPGWHRQYFTGEWHVAFASGDAQLQIGLAPDGRAIPAPVDLEIHYYSRKRGTPSLLSAQTHFWDVQVWHAVAQRSLREEINGTTLPLDEGIIDLGPTRRLVWATYWIDGRFTTSSLAVRLLEFKSGIVHGHSAVIAVSTPITSSADDARARLRSTLAAIPDLPDSLGKAGDLPAATR